MSRPFRLRELVLVLPVLTVFAFLLFLPHLQHGGFYIDDWSNGAKALQPPGSPDAGRALSAFADFTLYRPVLVVYVPLVYFVFGTHMHYHLAWAIILAVFAGTAFYGVLRALGVPWVHAALLAALTIAFPWSDATRLWATADQVTLSIVFMCIGLLVALRSLDRRIWPWHAGAATLYLVSILTYEITLPLIVCAGALYWIKGGWRRARIRWLIDVAVTIAGGAWVGANTARTSSGLSGSIDHLRQIISAGGTIVGRAGLALDSPRTALVLCVLTVVLGLGLAALIVFGDRPRSEPGWGLRQWLFLALGGAAVAALGWAMLIPADPYYTPTVYGEVNRVNGAAAFGLVLLAYGVLGVFGSLLGQLRPSGRWIPTGVTVVLALGLLASYSHVIRRHISIWDTAFKTETAILGEIKAKLPTLPHGTRLFLTSAPANQTLGVPIFTAWWDLNGAIKLEYDDSSLSARPVVRGLKLVCRPRNLALVGPTTDPKPEVPYGTALFLNGETGDVRAPKDRVQCRQVAHSSSPGALYLSVNY